MSEWVSVKDALPIEGIQVLTFCPNEYVHVLIDYRTHVNDDYFWACRLEKEQIRVTHWMFLPEEPMSEDDKELELIIMCLKCGKLFEINPEALICSNILNPSFNEFKEYVEKSKCQYCRKIKFENDAITGET